MVLPVVPCVILVLWLLITGATLILLRQMQSDASKRQGSLCQGIMINLYTAMALLVIPTTTTVLLPLEALIVLALVACVGLGLSETVPQLLGIARNLPFLVKSWLRAEGSGTGTRVAAEAQEDPPQGSRLCMLLAAYIPNETETLPRTLRQFLPVEDGGNGVELPPKTLILLTYNPTPTPEQQEVLDECAQLAERIPGASFAALLVPRSDCKAHNVNAGFAYLARMSPENRPDVVCVMDADIDVAEQNTVLLGCERLRQAEPSVAVVSVCTKVSIGSWLVAAEYAMKDIIMTKGYGSLISTGWLTGNFVFLRCHIALSYGFDEKCLVEDNDLMMRLLGDGYFVNHCTDLAVYTEAPPRLMAFLTQRTRWGQGATFLTLNRIPELVRSGSFEGMSVLGRLLLKFRLLAYGFGVRLASKYLIPFLLPTTLVLSWRCGRRPEECEHFAWQFGLVGHFGAVYMLVCFTAQFTGASFKHPWLRFYHYLAFVFLRIPYGIFNAQAPVIADAQYFLKLNKWIVTERHTSVSSETNTPSTKQKGLASPGGASLSTCSPCTLSSPLLCSTPTPSTTSLSSLDGEGGGPEGAACGAIVAEAAGTYVRTH
uniref:Glycosyltransferase 2-like domain-containing protein n=1 Tax=Pyrodinium bahamense TaxID=73915 RepID=A0A7S0F9S1_9DINO|mmetsp:Transcript_14759/g.40757  ORF Transcript_14759/g.40757 Transcript_14759/m.40757 type:complete len:599 (+) Transcript_14759:53-1849(+)|eukprot:CAMPEP_0179102668 /NCGR_PEP_ID=MMETSP0796-20121207/47530_1 /TAXON_ID=73915 /ORGANISM="Pyrodinium bahamense, Strain pbaha01" /LENGTH=598 /DNA_ID=CAMNT_0020800549 /DNA_START=28 /DNA_END=1824 /DNA_ORIENTATION=-